MSAQYKSSHRALDYEQCCSIAAHHMSIFILWGYPWLGIPPCSQTSCFDFLSTSQSVIRFRCPSGVLTYSYAFSLMQYWSKYRNFCYFSCISCCRGNFSCLIWHPHQRLPAHWRPAYLLFHLFNIRTIFPGQVLGCHLRCALISRIWHCSRGNAKLRFLWS